MVKSHKSFEKKVGYRGSKSVHSVKSATVKEQRADASSV
jgi:hypothetical protein